MSGTDTASLTVLIADDDPAALRLTARIAAMAGYHVLQAKNGHEALERILSDHPDMLITDWDMPGLNGVQLCRELRQRGLPFYVYVLLVTAKSRSEELVEGLEAGADDFITKPIDPAGLIARLRAGARTVAMEHHLREMARSDPLTGAMNRRTFFDCLAVEWDRAERYQQALSCVMIDLDFFKRINDTYGHAAGDAMLQAVAACSRTTGGPATSWLVVAVKSTSCCCRGPTRRKPRRGPSGCVSPWPTCMSPLPATPWV